MLPITRANLQSFCRNCLREFTAAETTHDIEQNVIRRNRLFPQKVCHCCYIKIKTLKGFQDRANLATGVLKLIIEERFTKKCGKKDIEALERRLKSFCRLCLKLNNTKSIENCPSEQICNDIKNCTGLQIDRTPIKLTKKTDPLADDVRYSHSICVRCQTTLKGFVEYRQVAKQTTDYLQSILDDDDDEEFRKGTAFAADQSFQTKTEKEDTELESVVLPCTRFDYKCVVNVMENELNELISDQEDVCSTNNDSPNSFFDNETNEEDSETTSTIRRNQKDKNPQKERKIKKSFQKYKRCRATTLKQNQDCLASQKEQDPQIDLTMQLETCKETETVNEHENVNLVDPFFKTEVVEDFIKSEFHGFEENLMSTQRKSPDDNTKLETINPIAHKSLESNLNSQSINRERELIKEETSSDSDVGVNYEPENVDYSSDSNSDDICLAKLVVREKKTRTNPIERKTKTSRQKIKRKSSASEQKAKYKCEQCNKSFFKKHTVEAHLKSHEGATKAFACKQCESSFTTYQALQRHANAHDAKGTTLRSKRQQIAMRYKSTRECPKCHLVLKRHIDLADHIRREHNGVYVFKCEICGKCLSTQAALNRHEQNHSEERPFACQFCEKRYNYETELKVHMQRHTADPALLCPICKTARANPDELQRHIASHRKPHQCSKCGKVFTKAYSLHQHDLSVHLNLKVHKCPDCDLSFKGRKTLTLHRLHHDPTGRPETCRVCGLYFRTKRGRLRHTSKFHPNADLPPEEPSTAIVDDGRNECCEKCPLRFKTKRGLMLHTKKTHEKGQRISKTEDELKEKYGDRSQICELCQLQCYSKKGLSRHIRKSHPHLAEAKDLEKSANRSEACLMCPLKFRTARGLLLHTKRMHRDLTISQEIKNLNTAEEDHKLSLPLNCFTY